MSKPLYILRRIPPPPCDELEDFLRIQRRTLTTTQGWSFENEGGSITVTAPTIESMRRWLSRHYTSAEVNDLMLGIGSI